MKIVLITLTLLSSFPALSIEVMMRDIDSNRLEEIRPASALHQKYLGKYNCSNPDGSLMVKPSNEGLGKFLVDGKEIDQKSKGFISIDILNDQSDYETVGFTGTLSVSMDLKLSDGTVTNGYTDDVICRAYKEEIDQ